LTGPRDAGGEGVARAGSGGTAGCGPAGYRPEGLATVWWSRGGGTSRHARATGCLVNRG